MECLDCGRFFNFPSQLKQHLQRVKSCSQKGNYLAQKGNISAQKGSDEELFFCDMGCKKVFTRKGNLLRHQEKCKGDYNPLICKKCKKEFKTSKIRAYHERNVECNHKISPEEKLRLRVEELEEKLKNKPSTIINNYGPVYNIIHDSSRKMMLCDNPDMEQNKLLCIEAFNNPLDVKDGVDDLPIDKIRKEGNELLKSGDYDTFYNFFWRNPENKVLQNMIMSPNPGATHCTAFKDGKIVGIEKTNMFEQAKHGITNVYRLKISLKLAEQIYEFLDNKKSRNCFYNTIRKDSSHFEYFKEYLVEEPDE